MPRPPASVAASHDPKCCVCHTHALSHSGDRSTGSWGRHGSKHTPTQAMEWSSCEAEGREYEASYQLPGHGRTAWE